MLSSTRKLLLMYLGITIGLAITALVLFFVVDDTLSWQAKTFILTLSGLSTSIFAYFHRPK